MKKVLIIGCPGSGKSTFARALQANTGLPLIHLDMLFWNEDRTTVPKEVFHARLQEVLQRNEWIIDGNYASTLPLRLDACDTVFFLDYPTELCLEGVRSRMNRPRADLPWIETEEDPEFMAFIRAFETQTKPQMLSLLQNRPHLNVIVFHSREEADRYFEK